MGVEVTHLVGLQGGVAADQAFLWYDTGRLPARCMSLRAKLCV